MELNAVSKFHKIEKSNEFSILDEMIMTEEAETTKSFEEIYSFLHKEENWSGKKIKSYNHIENPPKRGKYVVPNSTIDSVLDKLKLDVNLPKDKIKSSKRGKYLTPCPDILNIL